ncbi:hypothetical protein [Shewanella aestuarii]|uniref:Uncharacterized protein n=1 Tax=Shewanella aestuarii TaxID=1028752 RepID=A0A6G9QRG1_9GAMM|nr:hypothetical protein [Shewanella aestuarii]QIR16617.1 hypothetical protein HBH39_19265 [Shewanella aestuarii]
MTTTTLKPKYMHLTQYSRSGVYNESQILDLALEMGSLVTMPSPGRLKVSNNIAAFTFDLNIDDENDHGCDDYTLTSITKRIKPRVGATIVATCCISRPLLTQGDTATLVRVNDNGSWRCSVKNAEFDVFSAHYFVVC